MKKRSFSLFEVVIACSIISVMTLFAISQLKGFVTLENRLQRESHHALDLSYFTLKSKLLLEQNYLSDLTFEQEPQPSLSFFFKTPPVSDPLIPEKMRGQVDLENGALKIFYYSSKSDKESPLLLKEEILLSDVESVQWNFYRYNEKNKTFDLIEEWDQKELSKPQVVKLDVVFKKQTTPHTITFFLPAFHKLEFVV